MEATQELAKYVGVKPACDALRVPRATFYRRRRPSTGHQHPVIVWDVRMDLVSAINSCSLNGYDCSTAP